MTSTRPLRWIGRAFRVRRPGWRRARKSASVPAPVVAPEDAALLKLALAGDRGARRTLADRLIDPIQREVAIALTRAAAGTGQDARQEVRDLVQDVLLTLFEHGARELERWDPARGRNLESFVRLIARRRVARVLSQRRGNPWALVLVDTELGDSEENDTALLSRLEQRNQLETLLLALQARMDDRDHELFELLFVEERDPIEVAELVGISRGAVNAWGYRMRKLARALASRLESAVVSSSASDTMTNEEVERGR